MNRRDFLSCAAVGAAAACSPAPREESAARPPNILFLLTDDQRWDTIGAAGSRFDRTPNMDRLMGEGVSFRNNFVTTSICAVSRASFFTGLYARCHGVHGFRTPLSAEQHAYSYPGRLREHAGYRTGFAGKYGVGGGDGVAAAGTRFDFFEGFPGQGQYLVDGGRPHMTEHLGDQAVSFLDGCSADQPWNLSISFKAPHVQDNVAPYFISDPAYDEVYADLELEPYRHMDGAYFDSLPDYLKESENRIRWERRFSSPEKWEESIKRYHRLIHGVDVQIGRLLGELERREMIDNTVVVLAGDNGFYLGERGFAGKWYMHEESIRTPMVICDPRRPELAGAQRDPMTLNIDVSPTILSLAGLEIPASMNGRDLMPLAADPNTPWRSEWFYEHLFDHATIPKSEGVRSEDWKYFQFIETDPRYEELYDLAADPWEDDNLVDDSTRTADLERMRGRREAWVESLSEWRIDQPWTEPTA